VIPDVLDPNGDFDNDGYPNGEDLCPTVSSMTNRDHDGDLAGDACDPCPHLASSSEGSPDEDLDKDGVGNGCDPDPADPGESIAFFVGFYDPADIAGWARQGEPWMVANGRATTNSLATGGTYLDPPKIFKPNVRVIAGIEVLALRTQPEVDKFAGVRGRRLTLTNYHACHTRELFANTDVRFRTVDNMLTDTTNPFTTTTLGVHIYTLDVAGTAGTCNVDNREVTQPLAPGAQSGVGIEASFALVSADYVLVIERP
jgi:hypothetical protein